MVFFSVRLLPGDVVLLKMEEDLNFSKERIAQIRKDLGFDQPFWKAYPLWLADVARGNLGKSLWSGEPVTKLVKQRIPISLEITFLALIISIVIGIPLGIFSAIRQDRWFDYAMRIVAVTWLAVPGFWIAILALIYLSEWFGYFPPLGYVPIWEDFSKNIQQFMMPAFILAIRQSAVGMRITRSSMLEVLRQDYMRTARAKGLQERVVIVAHGLKNALIPVVTVKGNEIAFLLGGTVIIELIFALPGLGRLLLESVNHRDYTVLQGVILVITLIYVMINLLVDLLYAWLDPRIRYR